MTAFTPNAGVLRHLHLLLPPAFQRAFSFYLVTPQQGLSLTVSGRDLVSCYVVDVWTVHRYRPCGSIGLIPSDIVQGSKMNLAIVGKEILGILGEGTELCMVEEHTAASSCHLPCISLPPRPSAQPPCMLSRGGALLPREPWASIEGIRDMTAGWVACESV